MADSASIPSCPSIQSMPADTAAWEAVKAAYVQADKAEKDYFRTVFTPVHEWFVASGFKEGRSPVHSAEEHHNELCDVARSAMATMFRQSAPDARAIAFKIETIIVDEHWDCAGIKTVMECVLADLQRLAVG